MCVKEGEEKAGGRGRTRKHSFKVVSSVCLGEEKTKKKQADVAVITQTQVGVVVLHIYPEKSADAHTNKHKTAESHEDNSECSRYP